MSEVHRAKGEKKSGLSAFWVELKRRKVVRVAVAYAVVGWLIIQIASSTFPGLNIPDWGFSLIIMLVVLGFPVALILAWAFELTPEGVKAKGEARPGSTVADSKGHKLNYVTLGLVVLVLTFLVVDRYMFDAPRPRVQPSTSSTQGDRALVAGSILLRDTELIASGAAAIGVDSPLIALSPNSKWLVYAGRDSTSSRLYRKPLNGFQDPEPLPGTEGAIHAAISPDGQAIAFLTDNRLKRLSISGKDLRTLATTSNAIRAIWSEDDFIYFSDEQGYILRKVSALGGEVETVVDTIENSSWIFFSDILKGGQFALGSSKAFSISGDFGSVSLVDLNTGEFESLGISGYDARWIATGHLIFGRSGNLMAVPFDREIGQILDEPIPVIEGVAMESVGDNIQVTVAADGTLAYIPGTDRGVGVVVAVDRDGTETLISEIQPQRFGPLDLSEDDRFIAVHVADVKDYVWIYDLDRKEGRKLVGSDNFGWPKWNTDGDALALSSNFDPNFGYGLMTLSVDNAASQLVYTSPKDWVRVSDWSPTNKEFAIYGRGGIAFVRTDGNDKIQWMAKKPDTTQGVAVFSPYGKWISYLSNVSGRNEVYVRSYPGGDTQGQLSVNWGIEPVWCESGEIFFRRGAQFYSSAVQLEPELNFEPEQLAFSVNNFLDSPGRSYDVSSDGQTLYVLKRAQPAIDDRVHVLANWFDELNRLIPPTQ